MWALTVNWQSWVKIETCWTVSTFILVHAFIVTSNIYCFLVFLSHTEISPAKYVFSLHWRVLLTLAWTRHIQYWICFRFQVPTDQHENFSHAALQSSLQVGALHAMEIPHFRWFRINLGSGNDQTHKIYTCRKEWVPLMGCFAFMIMSKYFRWSQLTLLNLWDPKYYYRPYADIQWNVTIVLYSCIYANSVQLEILAAKKRRNIFPLLFYMYSSCNRPCNQHDISLLYHRLQEVEGVV